MGALQDDVTVEADESFDRSGNSAGTVKATSEEVKGRVVYPALHFFGSVRNTVSRGCWAGGRSGVRRCVRISFEADVG
jgi:hypothetical protein